MLPAVISALRILKVDPPERSQPKAQRQGAKGGQLDSQQEGLGAGGVRSTRYTHDVHTPQPHGCLCSVTVAGEKRAEG